MPTFFTVKMRRRVNISRFEGKVMTETTEWIEETYRDLPFSTAQTYQKRFPEAQVEITRQYTAHSEPAKRRQRGEYVPGTDSVTVASKKEPRSTTTPAASHSDASYAALVNEMVKDAA